jgi:Zn-dependent protease
MRGSLKLLTIAGIGIHLHRTILLLLAWIFSSSVYQGGTPSAALVEVGFILAVFVCVTLHELGHALTAARFGIKTRDITMLPIGGVARLERIPRNPLQEFLITIAGPAVNVAIAAALFLVLLASGGLSPLPESSAGAANYLLHAPFLERLVFVNITLFVFNLIPAFPMDGGRILRSLLASFMPYGKATQAAAVVGQVLAFGFGALGLLSGNIVLALIAVFIFLGAGAEARAAQTTDLFRGLPVREAMLTDFRTLPHTATLADAARELIAGSQQDFPVMDGAQLVGVLPRAELLRALASGPQDAPVSAAMRRDCAPVDETEMLESAFQRMQESGCTLLPVARRGQVVGLVSLDNIAELIMIRSARAKAPRR